MLTIISYIKGPNRKGFDQLTGHNLNPKFITKSLDSTLNSKKNLMNL